MVDSTILDISSRFASLLKHKESVLKVYLFGSYAYGKPNPESDIDLAVVFENFADRFDTQVDLMKLGKKIDSRIEPHPFRAAEFNASSALASEILKYGIVLE